MGNALVKAAVTDIGIQWACFAVAAYFQTEKFYDLVGSSTFLILVMQSIVNTGRFFPRQMVQSGMVCMWAVRLGLFLFWRTLKAGGDSRFKRVKTNPTMFFIYWTIQGLWVWMTLLPTLILNSKKDDRRLGYRDYAGWVLWVVGMAIEMIADYQKYTFRSDPANTGKWISHGLWSISRHPNYLGEIILWLGMFITASSTFKGAQWLSVLSPIFVAVLLTKVSGIPILDKQNLRRWGQNQDYQNYFKNTASLIPFIY